MAEYKFSDRLMFAIVMQNESLCRQFIERVFPDRKVADIKFRSDIKATAEATIIPGLLSKSVRLDVLFEDSDIYYDIEMQVGGEPFIAKRSRYYHSSMDTHTLKKGEPYSKLKPCYVIFICLHDPFGLGEPVYSFEMVDEKLGLQLGDGSFTIILEEANNDAEVIEIMTLAEDARFREMIAYDKGVAEGEQSGFEKGEQAGVERGSAQREQEIARNLIALGLSTEQIIKATGLSVEEIESLN